jgi:hypothetical protein
MSDPSIFENEITFPLPGGSHTKFLLARCASCGGLVGFPPANLELALSCGEEADKQALFDKE